MTLISRATILWVLALEWGCAASNAALNSAIAAGVAGYRRSEGECFNPCVTGTQCNPKTGLCDEIPCEGNCREDEYCDKSGATPRCVYVGDRVMKIRTSEDAEKTPDPHEPIGDPNGDPTSEE